MKVGNVMFRSPLLEQHKIHYKLKPKKTKRSTMRMLPNLELVITIPMQMKHTEIEHLIKTHEQWILEKRKQLVLMYPELLIKRQFHTGELYRFLGNEYTIQIIHSSTEEVQIEKSNLLIYTKDDTYQNKERLITKWRNKQAIFLLEELFSEIYNHFDTKIPSVPKVRLRDCKTIWGSCHYKKQTITLNKKLIHLPTDLIKYVIYHELVHLHHPNHSKAFYQELNLYVGDYKEYKNKIKKYSIYYF
jgi:predicted metal-dependent hydrolase